MAKPQNWNRFSYVQNSPIGYNDPTGHKVEEGDGAGAPKCDKKCLDSLKKKDKEKDKEKDNDECTGPIPWKAAGQAKHGKLQSWGCGQVDPNDWNALLEEVGDNVNNWSWGWYDTPYYNRLNWETLQGTGCFGEVCYTRTELNYIGEGEALAALGFSKEATHDIVWLWKNKVQIVGCALTIECKFREPSQGTIEMTDVGWDYYNQHYSGTSNSAPLLGILPYIWK